MPSSSSTQSLSSLSFHFRAVQGAPWPCCTPQEQQDFHRARSPSMGQGLQSRRGKPSHPNTLWNVKQKQQEWPGSGPAASGTLRFKLKWKTWADFYKDQVQLHIPALLPMSKPLCGLLCHLHLQPWVVPISKLLAENPDEVF